jgi:LuxR family quorum sensing-dependent transcriptional regulator
VTAEDSGLGREVMELIETLDTVQTEGALMQSLAEMASRHGFTSTIVTGVPKPTGQSLDPMASRQGVATTIITGASKPTGPQIAQKFLATGLPDGWVERYVTQRRYLHDPVCDAARRSRRPFLWSWSREWFEGEAGPARYPLAAKVLHDAQDSGLRGGLAVPIYRPQGHRGAVFFWHKGAAIDPRAKRALHVAGLYAYEKAEAMRAVGPGSLHKRPTRRLTEREREALRWTAAGKTSWEISVLFGIGEPAVNKLIASATSKLNAVNRTQAVVEAIRLGEIDLF